MQCSGAGQLQPSELVVGYLYDAYPTRRNVIGVANDCRYIEVSDFYKQLFRLERRLDHWLHAGIGDRLDLGQQFRKQSCNCKVDLLHFFNQVSYGNTPWISTYETTLPRLHALLNCHHGVQPSFTPVIQQRRIQTMLAAMASKHCRRLIALSDCALQIEQALTAHFPQWHDAIAAKSLVLPPPQPTLIDSLAAKPRINPATLNFLFVGASFFRKGGVEIVETFRHLIREHHYPLHLTVVSSLLIDNYATAETAADREYMTALLSEQGDWLTYHSQLDNQAVLQLMRTADIGLLPTYADTYGYVVLEFQAAGCPVITTDVRAMPEINNNDKGWMIPVPKNALGEAIYTTAEDRERISVAIRAGLVRAIEEALCNRQLIAHKAEAAWRGIREHHDPERLGEQLREIYLQALAD
jgi:glycosyltransferase involved in cell wall biosynthesis